MAESRFRCRDFDVLGILIRLFFAFAIGMSYDSGRMGAGFWMIGGVAAVALMLALPPVGLVTVEDGRLRLQRGWVRKSIPLEFLRLARSIEVSPRSARPSFLGWRRRFELPNEWRMTIAARRGVELVFKSDLPRRTKLQLPDEHTFRVIFSDRNGLLAALNAAGVKVDAAAGNFGE